MARVVNVHEAKTHLSRLLAAVGEGEEIVIARGGSPVARLVPIPARGARRTPGTARGAVTVAEDFDAALPPEIREGFGG